MKNVLKKVLCAVMVLSLIVTIAPTIYAAEELLLLDANFDALEDGVKTGLTSSEFTHTYYNEDGITGDSNSDITQLGRDTSSTAKFTTMSVGNAGYGKAGKALIYNVKEATAKDETVNKASGYRFDFKWVPKIFSANSKVTYEISFRAPENITNGTQSYDVMIPVGGSPTTLLRLETNSNKVSKISSYSWNGTKYNPTTLCRWEPGHWYNLAVTLTPKTNVLEYYLNGKKMGSGVTQNTYDYVGGRYKIVHNVSAVTSGKTYTSNMAIDDVRIYLGTPDTTEYSTAISSSTYRIADNTVYLGTNEVTYESIVDAISVANGGSVEVYTDSTYSTVAEKVTEGCKLVATSKNGRVLGYYDVAEKDIILDCDMEDSVGIAQNAFPKFEGKLVGSNGTGNGSIGSTIDSGYTFADYATGNVSDANSGKDGYAYFLEVQNNDASAKSPGIDFKFLPSITAGKTTFEISMLSPESYDTAAVNLQIPYNTGFIKMFAFEKDGKLGINNKYIRQWIPGRWYNFAVEITVGSNKADFYLNGDMVLDDAVIYDLNDKTTIEEVGGTRMRFVAKTDAGCSTVTAFDDVKVYTGAYDATSNEVLPESKVENYSVSEFGYIFTPDSPVNVNRLINYISGKFTVYEDDTFESTPVYTGEGQVLVATSENGNVVKYYTLVPDGKIAVTANDSAITELSSRETITIGAMANLENAYVFAAAYDAEGNFIGADLTNANGATNKPAKVSFNTKAGDIVKLMLWDKATLKPVGDMVTIQK